MKGEETKGKRGSARYGARRQKEKLREVLLYHAHYLWASMQGGNIGAALLTCSTEGFLCGQETMVHWVLVPPAKSIGYKGSWAYICAQVLYLRIFRRMSCSTVLVAYYSSARVGTGSEKIGTRVSWPKPMQGMRTKY